ncbi:hypothetical protein N5U06_11240, partial [Aliarcobacter butzleri]|nr:hypothetical protein [Aliarcobacter butzleri]
MEERINFDFNEVLEQFKNGKNLTGKDGLLAPLIKQLTEATLEAEVESHIANDVLGDKSNRRNSVNSKTIKGTLHTPEPFGQPADLHPDTLPKLIRTVSR